MYRPTAIVVSLIIAARVLVPSAWAQETLECDVPSVGTISTPDEVDTYLVPSDDGEYVSFTMLAVPPSGPDFRPETRLLRADGTPVPGSCGSWGYASVRDCGPLVASESPYRLEIRDWELNDTGTYHVHLQRLTAAEACEAVPLLCDVPLAGTIDDWTDTDLLTFTAAEGEYVSFTMLTQPGSDPDFRPETRLLQADGTPVPGSCGLWGYGSVRDCGPLTASESPYRLEIRDWELNDTGTYHVHLQRLTAAEACEAVPLLCDVPLTGTIDDWTDTDLLRLFVGDGDLIHLELSAEQPSGPDFQPEWRLLGADGTHESTCGNWRVSGSGNCGPLPASGNPYQVEVRDWQTNDTGSYRVLMSQCTPVSVDEPPTDLPNSFAMKLRAPNPVRIAGPIPVELALPHPASISLLLTDVAGRRVAILDAGERPAGRFIVQWDWHDLSAGIYMITMRANGIASSERVVVLR